MTRVHIAQGVNHAALQVAVFLIQFSEQLFHPLAFLIFLPHHGTATIYKRKFILLSKFYYIGFFHINQRPNHRMPPVVRQQLGTHGCQFTRIELIEKQRFDEIIQMMAESDLITAEPIRHCIEHTTPQTGTEVFFGTIHLLHLRVESELSNNVGNLSLLLAARRTIRAEAKTWMFETRF